MIVVSDTSPLTNLAAIEVTGTSRPTSMPHRLLMPQTKHRVYLDVASAGHLSLDSGTLLISPSHRIMGRHRGILEVAV
jgi:hypothetical protein